MLAGLVELLTLFAQTFDFGHVRIRQFIKQKQQKLNSDLESKHIRIMIANVH